MSATSIQWTDHSVNPIRFGRGHYCQKVSPGCTHCYASRYQPRVGNAAFGGTGSALPQVAEEPPGGALPDGSAADLRADRLWFDDSKLLEVLRRRKPTKWFWCDMTDLFGSWVPDEWIDRCFATMALTPQHTHQVLTKRPERMAAYLSCPNVQRRWVHVWPDVVIGPDGKAKVRCVLPFVFPDAPLPNVWLGTSVEDQRRTERIDQLRKVPAAVRFLSIEPLLGDVGRLNLDGIHWVIIGGENGPRPCNVEWVRSIVRQCQAAGVAAFVKQLGSLPIASNPTAIFSEMRNGLVPGTVWRAPLRDRQGGDIQEWPDDLKVRQFPATERPVPQPALAATPPRERRNRSETMKTNLRRKGSSDAATLGVLIAGGVFVLLVVLILWFWIHPMYYVWQQGKAGEAKLREAESSRQVLIQEAHAKLESAKLLAEAEVERAKGVAQANKIIGDGLKGNHDYLIYLWIHSLGEKDNHVIYVPTEANLPILEAGRFRQPVKPPPEEKK